MKKRTIIKDILFIFFAVLLLLLLVVAIISANRKPAVPAPSPVDTDTDVDTDKVVDKLGSPPWYFEGFTDTASLVVLKDENGKTTTYPAYYIINSDEPELNSAINYSWLNEKTGKNYIPGSIIKIEIPSTITSISDGVFGTKGGGQRHSEPNVTEVVLPNSITTLNDEVFRSALNLEKVTFSRRLEKIGRYCFSQCVQLKSFSFNKRACLKIVDNNAFDGCASLTSADFSNCLNLTEIRANAFAYCSLLSIVTLPDQLEVLGEKAFYRSPRVRFASEYLPSSLKYIGGFFMSGCSNANEKLIFPVGITTTGDNWFSDGFCSVSGKVSLVFLGKMTKINLSQTSWQGGYSGVLSVFLPANSSSELNGDFVEGILCDDKYCYLAPQKESGNGMSFTPKTDGELYVYLKNDVPNSSDAYGVTEDGVPVYSVNNEATVFYFGNSEKIFAVRNNLNGWRTPYFTSPFAVENE